MVEYILTAEEETMPPDGHFASGDDTADREQCDDIRRQLDQGNAFAWFTAKVEAVLTLDGETFRGVDYLGACSYESEADFRRCDYFADMKDAARANLADNIRAAVARGRVGVRALDALSQVSE